jgi:mannose-6-phosphate isomerase-like protein (cupin superfamily)
LGNETCKIGSTDVEVLLSSHTTGGRYTICQLQTASGQGLPLHTHEYEDGFIYVLEGEFRFHIGETAIPAPPGTSLFIPRGTPFAFHHQGQASGRFLVVTAPGGMDLLIRDLGALTRRGVALTIERIAPMLDKHGITPFSGFGSTERECP